MPWYCIVFDIIAVYCMSPHCILWYGMVLYIIWSYYTVSHCYVPLLQRAGELPHSASSHFDMSFCKESTMPFGAILDCSTSTCSQSSASSSPASSSGTHSTKTRTSFQGFCLDSPFVSSCYNCSRLVFFTTFVVYGFVPTIHWSFMNGFGSDEVSTSFERLTL